jgi:hypothetical protein
VSRAIRLLPARAWSVFLVRLLTWNTFLEPEGKRVDRTGERMLPWLCPRATSHQTTNARIVPAKCQTNRSSTCVFVFALVLIV